MLDSGGMPSSHSATVTALAFSIGLHEGTGGSTFAIAVVLACVVCTHSLTNQTIFFFSLSFFDHLLLLLLPDYLQFLLIFALTKITLLVTN